MIEQQPSETTPDHTHKVRAFECRYLDTEFTKVIHALNAGKARYEYLRDLRDASVEATFADIRVRCLGAPRDTKKFRHTADYRGKSDWHIGMEVQIGKYGTGVLVDSNSSANFNVLMLDGRWKGQTISAHPSEITLCG